MQQIDGVTGINTFSADVIQSVLNLLWELQQ